MSILKRCSTSFTRAEPTPTITPDVNEPRPSSTFCKQGSFSKGLRFSFIKAITLPLEEKSQFKAAQCASCHAQIIDTNDEVAHATCLEKDTTAAQQKAKQIQMATKARVQSLRDFFGIASPVANALKDAEKEEYENWHAYARHEKDMRQRYEQIAQEPADVEVMLRGWRVDHPPPFLSANVLTLVTEESAAAEKSGIFRSGTSELPPLAEDIIWNSVVLIPTPPSAACCQICNKCPTWPISAMYRLPCRHYLHVKCFEKDFARWLASSRTSRAEGDARKCIRCKGLKELTRVLPRADLAARIRRVGDKLLDWRRDKRSRGTGDDEGVMEVDGCPAE
jgi:hypothetical protein